MTEKIKLKLSELSPNTWIFPDGGTVTTVEELICEINEGIGIKLNWFIAKSEIVTIDAESFVSDYVENLYNNFELPEDWDTDALQSVRGAKEQIAEIQRQLEKILQDHRYYYSSAGEVEIDIFPPQERTSRQTLREYGFEEQVLNQWDDAECTEQLEAIKMYPEG